MLKKRLLNGVAVVIGAIVILLITTCVALAGAEGSKSVFGLWSDLLQHKLFFMYTFTTIVVCFILGFAHNPRKAL